MKKFNESDLTEEQIEQLENQKVIADSLDDYISTLRVNTDKSEFTEYRNRMPAQIKRCASGYIKNCNSKLDDWLDAFKDFPEVITELQTLKGLNPRPPR